MTIRNMAEVDARLEKAVAMLKTDDALTHQDKYELYEQAAIAMLDSDFDGWPDGELEAYLMGYLQQKQHELGITLG